MCAACVAQGITYVGGALATLQVMAHRARTTRRVTPVDQPTPNDPPSAKERDDIDDQACDPWSSMSSLR